LKLLNLAFADRSVKGLGLKIENERQEVCVKGGLKLFSSQYAFVTRHYIGRGRVINIFSSSANLYPRQTHIFSKVRGLFFRRKRGFVG